MHARLALCQPMDNLVGAGYPAVNPIGLPMANHKVLPFVERMAQIGTNWAKLWLTIG